MKRSIEIKLTAASLALSLANLHLGVAQEVESGPIVEKSTSSLLKEFTLSTENFHSAEESGWSGGVGWDISFGEAFGDIALGKALAWDLSSSGALSWDEDLNRTPILGEFGLNTVEPLFRVRMNDEWGKYENSATDGFAPVDGPTSGSELGVFLGITGRYETDQARNNSNGVAALNLSLVNPNRFNLFSLIPTVNLHIDAVFPDRMGGASSGVGNYGRLRGDTRWSIPLELLGGGSFLESSQLELFAEYTQSFGNTSALDAAGLDETWGAWAEYVYVITKNFNSDSGANSAPLSLFVRGGFGRLAPVAVQDETIMIGVRLGFEEIWGR